MNLNELDSLHLDVLREIGNVGAGNAATALAKILKKKIDMKIPQVKILEFSEVSEVLGGAEKTVIGIMLGVTGDITGSILFILQVEEGQMLVNFLLDKEPNESIEFDEMTVSALKEMGNILAGSYLSSLSTLTNLTIMPKVPEFAIDMAGAILTFPAIQFGKYEDSVLYIETEFIDNGEKVMGDFFLVPDESSYDVLLKALGVID